MLNITSWAHRADKWINYSFRVIVESDIFIWGIHVVAASPKPCELRYFFADKQLV